LNLSFFFFGGKRKYQSGSVTMSRGKTISWRAASLILLTAAFVAYANAFRGTFQFDDFGILDDQRLAGYSVFMEHFGQTIRPLLRLSFVVDRSLFGKDAAGYHTLNLLLHCGSGLLLFAILSDTLRCFSSPSAKIFAGVPFWTSLLFLLHPLETETVTYISGRATGLAAFFSLFALYLFARAADPHISRRVLLLRYAGCLASFALALLSKEVAVMLPAAVLLWWLVFRPYFEKHDGDRRLLALQLPLWGLLLAAVAVASLYPRYAYLAHASLQTRPLYDNLVTQFHAVAYSLSLLFIPSRLNFDHDLPVYHSILLWPPALSLALLAGLLAVALRYLHKAPFFSFGILWFLVHILPTDSVIPRYDVLSERNLYLPSIGILLAVVSVAAQFKSRLAALWPNVISSAARVACAVVATGLLIATAERNWIYHSQVTFWTDAAHKSPRKARVHNNLGYAFAQAGDLDRALSEFRVALSLDPDYATAQQNLLNTWMEKQSRSERLDQ
jgi:tetratricopeptide (TPR) repeat protein